MRPGVTPPLTDEELLDDPLEDCEECGRECTPDEITAGLCDECDIRESGAEYE